MYCAKHLLAKKRGGFGDANSPKSAVPYALIAQLLVRLANSAAGDASGVITGQNSPLCGDLEGGDGFPR